MATGVSGYKEFSNSAGAKVRVNYSETYEAASALSTVTMDSIEISVPNYAYQNYYLDGTIIINGTTVLTMKSATATHKVQPIEANTFYTVDNTSGSVTGIAHNEDGSKSVSIDVSIMLVREDGSGHTITGTDTITLTTIPREFTLSISAGTGSTITVKRGTTTLTNGATITYGDVLTITFGASTGYNLGTHTVNGSTFTSGKTHTVTAAVAVVATAALKTFTLSISAGTGSIITVKRNGTALSSGATITYGDELTITFGVSTGYNLDIHTVNGSAFTSGGTHTVTAAVAVVATAALKTFTLSISAGTGSIITVKRNGTALSSGATITYGDELTITFGAITGYNLGTHTVNGSAFTSGDTHTVTAAVAVLSTATVKSYTLSINAGTGSTITVTRTESQLKGADTGQLTDGATIYYNDVLTITFDGSALYEVKSGTVNGDNFTSGDTHTVTGAVVVITTTGMLGFVYLTVGGVVKKFRIIIYHNSKWVKYRPIILHSDTDISAFGMGDAIVITTSLPVTTDGETIIIGGA